ncbi:MAG: sulfatase-like hydrolase/transferase [Planctomycetes bacterium]|nr:sulfatase-like hydrolase/transferase [Planctomycetota bacterium]
MSTQPNILFIMSDEHDAAVTGCYGDKLVRTPNLDRLADEGILCDACYTPSPLCVPCRLSITAGKYVSRIGAWNNTNTLPEDCASLPRVLNEAGYESFLCGKQHYATDRRYGYSDLIPDLFSNCYTKDNNADFRDPRNPDNIDRAWDGRAKDFHPGDTSMIIEHDKTVTKTASKFLQSRNSSDKPFFMHVGYLAPHFPLIAPQEIYDYYKGKTPDPIPAAEWDKQPYNYQQQQLGFGSCKATEKEIRDGRDFYWALTDWFDRQIGELLEGLKNSDVADNTVIIYTSDHGENKGDHDLWWKNCVYDHGARVPMIVSWPARWAGGQRRTEACSILDVVQGIAELAGTTCHDDWDGDSIIPLFDNAEHKWKDQALVEYYGHNRCSGITMFRQGPWKYVYHSAFDNEFPAQYELYNMHEDPQETHNRVHDDDCQEIRQRLHQGMLDELGEHPDDIQLRSISEQGATSVS